MADAQQHQQHQHQQPQQPQQNDGDEEPLIVASIGCSYGDLALLIRQIDFGSPFSPSSGFGLRERRSAGSGGTNYDPSSSSSSSSTLRLSSELTVEVARFLVVKPVRHEDVTVVGASSHDGRHPLQSACLDPDEDSWWMSGPSTMPLGVGREHVEFQLTDPNAGGGGGGGVGGRRSCRESCRRLSAVSLKIPPLPLGPLSVLEFELLMPVSLTSSSSSSSTTTTSSDQQNDTNDSENSSSSSDDDDTGDASEWTRIGDRTYTVANRTGWQRFELDGPAEVKRVRLVCLRNQMSPYLERDRPARVFGGHYESVGFYSVRFE